MYKLKFNDPIHIHFIGIGGISMSGLAEILLEKGFTISGSDAKESDLTRMLASKGALPCRTAWTDHGQLQQFRCRCRNPRQNNHNFHDQ